METVGERLAKAQASGNLSEIRAALQEAQAAGADPAQIQVALAEVEKLAESQGGPDSAAAQLRARAEAHKKRGNDRLKDGTKSAAKEALDHFTDGLEVKCSDGVLNAQLYSNRAHVRIMLRQFVEAVDDCRKAIELDPKNLKSYWRAAKASLNLDLCKNGIEFCEAGLKIHPKDPDLLKLRDSCAEKLASLQQRRAQAASSSAASSSEHMGDFNADEAMALQDKVNSLADQVESLKATMAMKQREKLRIQLTQASIAETTESTNLFVSVGRCFLGKERSSLEESLGKTVQEIEVELPKLSKTLEELERRRESAEKEFREMIQSFRQQQSAQGAPAA